MLDRNIVVTCNKSQVDSIQFSQAWSCIVTPRERQGICSSCDFHMSCVLGTDQRLCWEEVSDCFIVHNQYHNMLTICTADFEFLLLSLLFVVVSYFSTVRLWSLQTFTCLVCYKGHNYPVWDVEFRYSSHYALHITCVTVYTACQCS